MYALYWSTLSSFWDISNEKVSTHHPWSSKSTSLSFQNISTKNYTYTFSLELLDTTSWASKPCLCSLGLLNYFLSFQAMSSEGCPHMFPLELLAYLHELGKPNDDSYVLFGDLLHFPNILVHPFWNVYLESAWIQSFQWKTKNAWENLRKIRISIENHWNV